MAWLLTTGFRLLLWFLLTADASATNLLIGLALAVLLPRPRTARGPVRPFLKVLLSSLLAVPRAYGEALALVLAPAEQERLFDQPACGLTSPLTTFLEVFAITLTPFTIVLGLQDQAGAARYRVHQLLPCRQTPGRGPENRP
jgi:multicomponent Na+:H+ antiporter subunit E